jgi:hypothetical protein
MAFAPGPGAAIATVYIIISVPLLVLQLTTLPVNKKIIYKILCFKIA